MAAHLQKATVIGALAPDEDCLHGSAHIVVDAALARALEESERPVMGIEDHLLALARIGAYERHARVAQPHMSDLDHHGRAVDQDDLVAPVELIGLARCEDKRHVGIHSGGGALAVPAPGVAAYRIV